MNDNEKCAEVCRTCDAYAWYRGWCLLLDRPEPSSQAACWMWTPPGMGHSAHITGKKQ